MLAGYEMCRIANSRLNSRFAELEELVGNFDCYDDATADWVLKQEGIDNAFVALTTPKTHALLSHGPGVTGSVCNSH
jgi:hypothetical protein